MKSHFSSLLLCAVLASGAAVAAGVPDEVGVAIGPIAGSSLLRNPAIVTSPGSVSGTVNISVIPDGSTTFEPYADVPKFTAGSKALVNYQAANPDALVYVTLPRK